MAQTFAEKDIESSLIAMGAKGASPDSETMTMAVSKKTPGVIVPGAVTGSTPGGQGIAPTPTQFQAITGNNGSAEANAFLETQRKREADAAQAAQAAANMRASSAGQAVAGYTDSNGVYHPPTTTVAPPAPTIGQMYGGAAGDGSELDAAYANYGEMLKGTQAPIDEAAIREQTLQKFQAQIDSLNNYYNTLRTQKVAAETAAGEKRLGTNAAIQRARGLIGSDFGAAQTDTINKGTQDNINAINESLAAQKANEIAAILGKVQQQSQAEIDAKEAAKKAGAQEYIDFLKGQAERKNTRTNDAVAALLGSSAEPDDGTIQKLAKELGISVDQIKKKITETKSTAAAEAAKNAPKLEVIDGQGYQIQPDGSYKLVIPKVEAEKPLIVGGMAYTKQDDGTYKPIITPEKNGNFVHVSATKYQPAGVLDKNTGIFTPDKGSKPVTNVPTRTSTPKKPTPAQDLAEAKSSMTKELSQLTGSDGFIAPDTYTAAKQEWVNQGYSPSDFDSTFKGFRNPGNENYTVGK